MNVGSIPWLNLEHAPGGETRCSCGDREYGGSNAERDPNPSLQMHACLLVRSTRFSLSAHVSCGTTVAGRHSGTLAQATRLGSELVGFEFALVIDEFEVTELLAADLHETEFPEQLLGGYLSG